MTNPDSWSRSIEQLPVLHIPNSGRVVIVAPHPDDETLGLGGLIHDWKRTGIDIRVLIISDGSASHVHFHPPSDLAEIRKSEALSAAAVLGIQGCVTFLGFPDGGLTSLHSELVAAIRSNLDTEDRCEVEHGDSEERNGTHCIVLAPRINDGHPDHDACAQAAAEVAATSPRVSHWSYGVWTWTQPPFAEVLAGASRWPISDKGYKAKWGAISKYASQVTPILGEQIVTDRLLQSLAVRTEVVWC